ncbi:MAG TPA: hypothetical protein ENN29_00030 [Candidatus Hydrogenedentes bacterium]|nr:hypothetical protein [Candidatus Hydrogenedentota bacterium]
MIEHGMGVRGDTYIPLFAEELDRATMRMLEGEALEKVAAIPREDWGIRSHDRMLGGANPQHCQNLYQILYVLSDITGERRYAENADASLKYFLEHCQSKATGLFYWGEHAGWDMRGNKAMEKRSGDIHEFYRPWALWKRSRQLAPEACRRFAHGLWEHQIGDHKTGDYSRHAKISEHGPGTNAPYARHGGFYIETWAAAYAHTGDPVLLKAVETVVDGLERARLHDGGYLVGGSVETGSRRAYDISLAVSLELAANSIPGKLAEKLRAVAAANDDVFDALHPAPGAVSKSDANLWTNAYGSGPRAGHANTLMLRYRQTQKDAYRRVILAEADMYLGQQINLTSPVWPGTVGEAVWLMLNAYELTGEEKYLDAAERFAQESADLFLSDNPLPKASHAHNHYEAVTNGDTLMMALLRLWAIKNNIETKTPLTYTDR